MNNINKYNITYLFLAVLFTTYNQSVNAAMRFFYEPMVDDVFMFDFDRHFADMDEHFSQIREHFKQINSRYNISPEDDQLIKEAKETVSKIKANVDSDENNVYITFNLDNINKDEFKGPKKVGQGWFGSIPVKNAKLDFYISRNSIEIARIVELKKESKEPKEKSTKEKDDKKNKPQQNIYFYSSKISQYIALPAPVNLETAKAEIKDNNLKITITKKKETKRKEVFMPLTQA